MVRNVACFKRELTPSIPTVLLMKIAAPQLPLAPIDAFLPGLITGAVARVIGIVAEEERVKYHPCTWQS